MNYLTLFWSTACRTPSLYPKKQCSSSKGYALHLTEYVTLRFARFVVSYPDFVLTVVRLRVEVLCNRFNGSKLKPGPNSVRFVEEVLGALV